MLTFLSVTVSLAIVLLLIGVAMRALRHFASGAGLGRGRVPLEVLQRVALGPKQGIALIRVGEQVLAVSVGEGGIRPLMEVGGEDREALLAPVAATPVAQIPPLARSFQAALKSAMRGAAVILLLAVPTVALAQAPAPPPAQRTLAPFAGQQGPAQGAPAARTPAAAAAQATPAAAPTRAVAPPNAAAGQAIRNAEMVDQMIPRLAPRLDLRVGEPADGGLRLSGTVGVVIMMGLLTLLPTLILMMTSFTRVIIVLHFLRQALGTQSAPPAHLMSALALLLTGFIMAPTLSRVNQTALQPWMNGQMEQGEMLSTAAKPFRQFMLAQTRDGDLGTFMSLSRTPAVNSVEDVPLVVLMSAFVTSELKTAFQIGFALFLPFIIIDIVVSSVLMSMGMFMLPPAMIALPFKLLLFVLVDGWALVVQGLVQSFR